jgi:calcineurin-like phosphoesterase family protein
MYIHYDAKDICMTHRAENADPGVPWNFCGHVHEKYKVKRLNENSLIVNLCVEVWNYYPVSFNEINSSVAAFLKEEKQGEIKDA